MATRSTWSDADLRDLTTMWRKGAASSTIATALTIRLGRPVTRAAVMGQVSRLGLSGQGGSIVAPAEKRAPLQNPTPAPESQQPVEEVVSIAPPSEVVEKIDTPRAEPARPVRATKPAPKYARAHAAPAPPALTVARAEPRPADWPPAAGILLADLRRAECRFPVTGFHAATHRFCAAAATDDSPYCAEHRAAALQAPVPGRKPGRYPGWASDGEQR